MSARKCGRSFERSSTNRATCNASVVKDAIEKLGGALVPPGIEPNLAWRLVVSGTLFVVVFSLAVHIVWACGLLGDSGFAHAADVDETKRLILEEKLDKIYTVICIEDEIDAAVAERARNLQRQYREVNDEESYPVDCELLRKIRNATQRASEDPA